jgi:hypothetical protein
MNLLKSPAKPPIHGRTLLTVLALVAIAACLLVLLPAIRTALIAFGGSLLHRTLDKTHWQHVLVSTAFAGLFVSAVLLFIISNYFEIISDMFPPEKCRPYYTIIELGLIGFFAGAAILFTASNNAIWVDEAYSLAPVRHSWRDLLLFEAEDVHPPLFFLLEKCWSLVFGTSVFAMKFVSMLPMVLTMLIVRRFLKKEVPGTSAILFLLCCAASFSIVHYSIEIRMYSLALFFVTMAALNVWHIITIGKARYWALFLLCALGAAYTHYYAAAACVIGFLLLFAYVCKYKRPYIRAALCTALGAIIGYLPWLFTALRSFTKASGDFWIEPLTFGAVARYAVFVFNAGNSPFIALIFFALFIAVFILSLTRKNKTKIDFFAFCALSCIIILAIIGILIALFIRPLIVDRYLFPACGLVWLFFAVECSYIRNKRVFAFICTLLITFSFLTFSTTLSTERQEGKDFSRFYEYMAENLAADDMFLFPENQSGHLVGITAYLFPGHVHICEVYGGTFGDTLFWHMFDSTHVSYNAFNTDDDRDDGRPAWILVMNTDEDGNPTRFTPSRERELHGEFGWNSYAFKLYYTTSPGSVVDYLKNALP